MISSLESEASSATTRTLVSVATYNEIENLPRLVEEIFLHAPDAHLLVIDDNSPDGTGRWCDEQAAREPRLRVLHRPGKLGLGTATIAAMQYAIDHGYEFLVNLDADFSHPPAAIPALRARMDGVGATTDGSPAGAASAGAASAGAASGDEGPVDVAIGSRYVPGGAIEGWPWHRHFMSQGVNLYARSLLRLSCRDCSGAFRCYRTAALARLDLAGFWSVGYSFQEEVLWRLKQVGARMAETPITFVERQQGSSKIHLGEAVSAVWIIFRLGLTEWVGV